MAIVTVGTDAWTSIVTTAAETVFQNRTVNPMYITTESTSGLDFDKGFYLAPDQAVVLSIGVTVSGVTFRNPGPIFYMTVE